MKRARALSWPLPALACACVLASCGGPPGKAEIVLCRGSRVTVRGSASILDVGASSLTTRTYRVNGFDFAVELIPRWERWNGNLGIYRPASGGDTHVVLEEGQQFFAEEDDLYQWIDWARQWPGELRYTNDGLLMHWNFGDRDPAGKGLERFLSVDVVQLMLRGEKPRGLQGASDSAFAIENPNANCTIGEAMHSDFVASEPATIDGREYSGWAIDVMRAHDITPKDVEQAIARGRAATFEGNMTYEYRPEQDSGRKSSFRVRTDPTGKVTLVFL